MGVGYGGEGGFRVNASLEHKHGHVLKLKGSDSRSLLWTIGGIRSLVGTHRCVTSQRTTRNAPQYNTLS
jgi:hypothetical protein